MRLVSAYSAILMATALTDAAVLRIRESASTSNLGPAPFETLDESTKKRYREEKKINLNLDAWDGFEGVRKGTDRFRCHGSCGLLSKILDRDCKDELAQSFVNYCLGGCVRAAPGAVYPSAREKAEKCNLKPENPSKSAESSSTLAPTTPTTSPTPPSHILPSERAAETTASPSDIVPSSPGASQTSVAKPDVTIATHMTPEATGKSPAASSPVNGSPDPYHGASEGRELAGGHAATRTQMGTGAATTTSNVNLTSGDTRLVNLQATVVGAALLAFMVIF